MINWCQHPKINVAVQILYRQGVLAYPTEAVWGLGCDPWSEAAVAKILELKRRPVHKGLILIGSHWDQFAPFLSGLRSEHLNRLKRPNKNPLTWLIPHNGAAPDWIVGNHDSLAVRVTQHPVAAALCHLFDGPIVSTSANPQGLPAATSGFKVKRYFSKALDYQTPGHVGGAARASEIQDLLTGEVIRQG